MKQRGKKRFEAQVAESVQITSPDDGKPPADRRALQLAAKYLGDHCRLLAAFGMDLTTRVWHTGSETTHAEHEECMAAKRKIEQMAAISRPVADGMVGLEGGDI